MTVIISMDQLLIEAGYTDVESDLSVPFAEDGKMDEVNVGTIFAAIKSCPLCGKNEIVRYFNVSDGRHYAYCRNIAGYIKQHLEEQKQQDTKDRKLISKSRHVDKQATKPAIKSRVLRSTKKKDSADLKGFMESCSWHISMGCTSS